MGNMLSVYFSSDRTYLSVVEPGSKGLNLKYINSTENPIDLENPDDLENMMAVKELKDLLAEIENPIDRVSVTLPADTVLVTKIPSKKNMQFEEIKKLVELEIRNAYPQFNYKDFIPSVLKFEPKLDGKEIMLAVIIPKINFISCRDILMELNTPISNIEISQLNSHSAFMYNYPERNKETVAIVGVGQQFVDVSVIKAGIPVYYNLAKLKDKEMIGDVCLEEFERITKNYAERIDSAYLFGEGLNIDMLVIAQSFLMGTVENVGKLNGFRMFTSQLDKRQRDYCSRMAHVFPPCIGGNMPSYYQKIKMF